MNTPPPRPMPMHVPVLTEVVEMGEPASTQVEPAALNAEPAAAPAWRLPAGEPAPALDETQITQRVLTDIQRQIDGMLEYRLRETLAPLMARASEALVRELRQELSKTMRDVVSRAVAQEIARQRSR